MYWYNILYRAETVERISITTSRRQATSSDASNSRNSRVISSTYIRIKYRKKWIFVKKK